MAKRSGTSGKAKSKAKAKTQRFCLVRWLEDETVSVVPASSADGKQKLSVGAMTSFKWLGKFYDAEVLKLSDNRSALFKECDKLVNMEVTREDLLIDAENEVDSTTEESPVKKRKVDAKKSQMQKKARIDAAKMRAKEMFATSTYKIPSDSDSEVEDSEVIGLKTELARLKKQLQSRTPPHSSSSATQPIVVSKNFVSNSKFDAIQKTVHNVETLDDLEDYEPYKDTLDEEQTYEVEHTIPKRQPHPPKMMMCKSPQNTAAAVHITPHRPKSVMSPHNTAAAVHVTPHRPKSVTSPQNTSAAVHVTPHRLKSVMGMREPLASPKSECLQVEKIPEMAKPAKVELVEGYGVFLTHRQLDEATDQSANSPTKLVRNLMNVFFTPEVLAQSSAFGTRKHPALNRDIVSASIRYVQQIYAVSRSVLVDAINDKCANFRRKEKQLRLDS